MIVPSIDLMNGRAVQLVGGAGEPLDMGDPFAWLERFARVGEVAVIDLDAALGRGSNEAVIMELVARAPCRVGGGIRTVELAKSWLDRGARKVILGTAATPDVLRQLPRERVIAALDAREGEVVVEGWRRGTGRPIEERMHELEGLVGGFLVTFVEREGRMAGTDLERAQSLVEAAGGARLTAAGGITTAAEIAALDRIGVDAQVGMAIYTGALGLAEAFAAPLVSDREDGLWPTVVTDEEGKALGLAWSDPSSLREALETGAGVYRSRSRGRWRKGESSGATQSLLRAEVDCDRDSLRFVVRQAGPGFCHTGTRGCWGNDGGLSALQRRLARKSGEASEDSYTARLLADPSLLRAKLEEEALELAQANGEREVVHEAADLLYFASVALARAGVSLSQVEAELDRRALRLSRRGGDAKPRSPAPARVDATQSSGAGSRLLPRRTAAEVERVAREPVDPDTLEQARAIVADVRAGGEAAIRAYCGRFEDLGDGGKLFWSRAELRRELEALEAEPRALLERTARRIRAFAEAQLSSLGEIDVAIPGGRAGHRVVAMDRAGCYAPGGRFPLPSSVLMITIPARTAGVREVWVASPRPTPLTLAAAAVGGADGLIAAGGAHAIAALAFGAGELPACDIVVGPGNRWVTAAKKLVAGSVAIDMLAGPSELVVVADDGACAETIAADLLAQAEHDPDASPILIATSEQIVDEVEGALRRQLEGLPTAAVAKAALRNGFAVVAADRKEAARLCDRLAPEHVELLVEDPDQFGERLRHYGALFVGAGAAEVLGDYGIGPNHVLPTGGGARSRGGLSTLDFLRVRTWMEIDDPSGAVEALRDAAALARWEGLEAHARAAERRLLR